MDFDPVSIIENAPVSETFFQGFTEHYVDVPEGRVFCRVAGSGPPLLLLHGYPQTSAIWHRVAPVLAGSYTVICADLRGYGRSCKPAATPDHSAHSKRAMAGDLLAMMDQFGFHRFLVGAHDRGARVAHRMAADNPDRVLAAAILDIAPTREMYRETTMAFAKAYYHWFFLIQDAPYPERIIAQDPDYYLFRKCGSGSAGVAPFARQALMEYRDAFRDPDAISSSCEDYRAAASIDIRHDDEDTSKLAMPVHVLWGDHGAVGPNFDVLGLWRERAEQVEGHGLPGGHYLAEELPDAVLAEWIPFFDKISQSAI